VAAHLVVEPRTPLIVVKDESPYAVIPSTPSVATPHNPTAFAPAAVQRRQNLWVMLDEADFRGQRRSQLLLIVLLLVGSREREVNSLGLIRYLVYEVGENLLDFLQGLSHDLLS